ncbi:hypothetical protein OIU78_004101 [Salix suchowensis]|nr:hypothetical protein OIU78_004101 [Salix suchowensis]
MDCASSILHKKLERSEVLKHHLDCPGQENCVSGSCCVSNKPESAISGEDLEQRPNGGLGVPANTESIVRSGVVPLLNRDADTRPNPINETPRKSCGLVFSNRALKYRPSVFVIAVIAVCFRSMRHSSPPAKGRCMAFTWSWRFNHSPSERPSFQTSWVP